jgi:hypothetical protein
MPQNFNLFAVYYFRLILSLSRSLGVHHVVLKHRYVMDRPIVPEIWHVQEGTNLTQNEVRSLKELGFVVNKGRSI